MWVAVLLGGWMATSLVVGPLVGRFVSAHMKEREEPAAKTLVQTEVPKPIGLVRRI